MLFRSLVLRVSVLQSVAEHEELEELSIPDVYSCVSSHRLVGFPFEVEHLTEGYGVEADERDVQFKNSCVLFQLDGPLCRRSGAI